MSGAAYAPGKVAVAICGRCGLRHPYRKLAGDRNVGPGLRVCRDDNDQIDPYRLPARPADAMTLRFPRPDVSVATSPQGIISEDGTAFAISEDGQETVEPG